MEQADFSSIMRYPEWARELAERYLSGSTCMFVLHGNVHDLIGVETNGEYEFSSLHDFLATEMFGSWDVVGQYDLGGGMRPRAGSDSARLRNMLQYLSGRLGDVSQWPRDPGTALAKLENLLERNLLEEKPDDRKRIALILDFAQYIVPAGPIGSYSQATGANLVRMLGWAQNPYFRKVNTAICLIADKLAELNDRLVQNPYVATIEIPMPTADARAKFLASKLGEKAKDTVAELAETSNGLSLVSLDTILSRSQSSGKALKPEGFAAAKKEMIEQQCHGLLEFVPPRHSLDLVVGHTAAKQRLKEDADLLLCGKLDAAPMGYLISGAVGTGKTFLAECYAGSIGIPCVKLRNFRSKYVGETEGNLERVLVVLRSLGPVVVIIDEADAALGDRDSEGDSGTSNRVFSMIASQMGDTRYRGRIVWMLLTCRPDLLPIDLKRQGRAEVHIPLFYPEGPEELSSMIEVMARKNRVMCAEAITLDTLPDRELSGADIESVLLLARRLAMSQGRDSINKSDVKAALGDFIPSVQGLEKEMQELAAVLECTQMSFLPELWRKKVALENGRTLLQERMVALRQIIEQ